MGLEYAIDELYATGWTPSDPDGCQQSQAGRAYPSVRRIEREFEAADVPLRVRFVSSFGCHQAQWGAEGSTISGAVVGESREEAAVFALARLRRTGALADA